MAKIEDLSVDDLEEALEKVHGKREIQRLMIAIIYKRGPSVPMIAEWLDMREGTIYDWFDRLEERPIHDAITDDQRPGRPPKLDEREREDFEEAVNKPPIENGYGQRAWSTKLAKEFLQDEFGVEYSMRHVTRLLNEAGLNHTPRSRPSVIDDEREIFWEPVKNTD